MSSRLTVVLVSQQLATPALMFFLLLLILPATMAIQCPEGCWCDSGKYRVTCPMSSFNNITSIHLKNVLEFHLVGNSVTSLKKDSFISKGLTELQELSLNRCGLETIEVRAFNGLTELTYLSLRRNRLSAIIPGTFQNVSNLQYLGLQDNIIDRLEVDVFSGLINLKYVHLTNNKLTSVHPDVFLGLPTLEIVHLSKNPALQIPTDRHFINSHSLRLLDISQCNTSSVSVETFANVTALESLDLRFNNLRSVHINILTALPKLSALYVGGNPLQCDCQLQQVWRWCQDHNIQTVHEGTGPHCVIPSQGNSLPWMVLEERQCLQDNIRNNVAYQHKRYKRQFRKNTPRYHEPYIIDSWKQLQLPIHAGILLFGTTGNLIVFTIFISNKQTRTISDMYIINLAASGLIMITVRFCIYFVSVITVEHHFKKFFLSFLVFCYRFCVCVSPYSVAMLSYRQYRDKVKPNNVPVSSHPIWLVAVAYLGGLWIVSGLFALPTTFITLLVRENVMKETLKDYSLALLFDMVVVSIFPLCMIAFCYIMYYCLSVENPSSPSEENPSSPSEETQQPQPNTRKVTSIDVLGLTLVFLITYLPHFGLEIYIVLHRDWYYSNMRQTDFMYEISSYLILINACLNPVALLFTSRLVRKYLKRCLTCRCKENSPPPDMELTIRN